MALASPIAYLRHASYSPAVLDLAIETLDPDKISEALFVGISVPMHTALRLGIEAARRVREINQSCHICFYGLYASLNETYLLENVADSIIGGEIESPLAKLIDTLANGKDPSMVQGVSTRERQEEPYLEKITPLLPHRNGLPPLESYAHLYKDGEHLPVGTVEASRGCKHLCLHCPIPPVYKGRFFAVPREIVLEDIQALLEKGAKHITFADPDFLNGPAHALRIARALHDKHPELTFDFTAKVEHLVNNKDLLPEFARLGCIFIVSAVESLSDTVLANLDKGHTRADTLEALNHCNKANISIRPSLLSFTPWTSAEDYLD
ncbi:MAG: radical SAM protein, partial [Nitrospinaceae bacterium]|nr:radical SAM protein [Nitrospinaceae bacterium]